MSQLPIGWKEVHIGEVTQIVSGGTPSTKDPTNFSDEGGIPWITPSDLSGYEEIYIGCGARNLSKKGFDSCSAFLLPKNSVLFSSRAPIGYVAIASNELATNQGFKSFILPPELDSKYIYYYLRHITPIAESVATGTTFKELSTTKAKNLPLLVPPQNEQKRIVDKLDRLLARIDACQERLDRVQLILENFRQSVLAEATSGMLTQDWRIRHVESHEIRFVSLGETNSNLKYGTSKKSEPSGIVPVLRMGNIQGGKLDWNDLVYTSDDEEIERYELLPGDVLFNRTNSPELVGKTAVYKGEQPAIYAGYLIRIRCSDDILPGYLSYCLNSPAGQEWRWLAKTDGVSQSNINAQKLAAFQFILPSVEEQIEIINRVETLFGYADRLEQRRLEALKKIKCLTPSVLQKAFEGDLVPQNLNDEPASVLLKRIQEARANAPAPQKKSRRRPDMTDKKTTHRKKAEPISIVQALSKAGQELSANDLFIEAGYPSDADSEQVEAFFVAIRDALANKEISKARRHDRDWFTLESEIVTNEN